MAQRLDVEIEIAGCLIWLAPRSLGGLGPKKFADIWMGDGKETVDDLIKRGLILPLALYQDDGYSVRFVQGEMTQQEKDEWTAHARMNLNVPCGELLVSGVLTPDFAEMEFPAIIEAKPNASSEFGFYFKVPPGSYLVDVYSYPPGDLSAGWGHIVQSGSFGKVPGVEPEKAIKYFERTRPGETPPTWVKEGFDENSWVNFLVRISDVDKSLTHPQMDEDGAGVAWEFRKPEKCPLGIPLSF